MTTIAWRDGILAADSQITVGDKKATGKKLFRFGGYRAGFCGSYADYMEFMRRIKAGEAWDDIAKLKLDVGAIMLCPQGAILVEHGLKPSPIHDEYWAIGSGAPHAMTAMDMGASAREAIRMACKRDIYSSLPVKTIRL